MAIFLDYRVNTKTLKRTNKPIKASQNQLNLLKENRLNKRRSNGKGENKKKKFDFHKEMKQFQTNATDSSDNLKNKIQTELVSEPSSLLSKTINDLQQEAVSNVVTTVKGQLSETISDKGNPSAHTR